MQEEGNVSLSGSGFRVWPGQVFVMRESLHLCACRHVRERVLRFCVTMCGESWGKGFAEAA